MKAREHLLTCLKEEGGVLSNARAHKALCNALEKDVSRDEYEEIKEQLIGLGLAAKGRGKGGSLRVVSYSPANRDSEETRKEDILQDLLISIRRTPGAFAKLNKSSITCLLSSSKDKLYAGFDAEGNRYHMTYRVEKDSSNKTPLVISIFGEASKDMSCAELTTGNHYTRIYLDDSLARMNLLIRRLCDLLEEEDLENSLDDNRYWTHEFGHDSKDSYFNDVAQIISYAAENGLEWPFGSSFRKAFGFDSVDHLVTIGRSFEAMKAPARDHYREHVVPAVRIKEKALEMASLHASAKEIAEFLRRHLLVVILTKHEAAILDRLLTDDGISLRTSMPGNWIWGDDPLERLECAGIKVELFKEYTHQLWKPWKPRKWHAIRYWLNKPLLKF